jgi:hypothetical protein
MRYAFIASANGFPAALIEFNNNPYAAVQVGVRVIGLTGILYRLGGDKRSHVERSASDAKTLSSIN